MYKEITASQQQFEKNKKYQFHSH